MSNYITSILNNQRFFVIMLVLLLGQVTAHAQHRFKRTYETDVWLNNTGGSQNPPYDPSSRTQENPALIDMVKAFSLNEYKRVRDDTYGIKMDVNHPIQGPCAGCLIKVEVYDKQEYDFFGDYQNYNGLIVGMRMDISPYNYNWTHDGWDVETDLLGNIYNLGTLPPLPAAYKRSSLLWKPNEYASVRALLAGQSNPSNFLKPFEVVDHKVVVRVTIVEEHPNQVKRENIESIYVPGIGEIHNGSNSAVSLFNFDEPQKREPMITMLKNGRDGTYDHEDFISTNDGSAIYSVSNSGQPYNDQVHFADVGYSCDIETNWPLLDVKVWEVTYEPNTVYENTIKFYLKKLDYDINPGYWDNELEDYYESFAFIPRLLRRSVEKIHIQNNNPNVGALACARRDLGHPSVIIFDDQNYRNRGDFKHELLLHETSHLALEYNTFKFTNQQGSPYKWDDAVKDDGRYVSEYALKGDGWFKEALSEHFPVYLWLRTKYFLNKKYPTDHIKGAKEQLQYIDHLPNRMYFFENILLGIKDGSNNPVFTNNNGQPYPNMATAIYPLVDAGEVFDLNWFSKRLLSSGNEIATEEVAEIDNFEGEVLVFPNPSSGRFKLEVNLSEEQDEQLLKYQILSLTGQVISTGVVELDSGMGELEMNLRDRVERGVYLLFIKGNTFSDQKRLLIAE